MEVFRWPSQSAPPLKNTVVTLGIFDGVHAGHCRVIELALEAARERHASAVAVTFDRHPASVTRQRPEPMITSLRHRLRLLAHLGLGSCLVIEFTDQIAGIEAPDFVRTVLCGLLDMRVLVLGFDCRFGKDRKGDAQLCAALGRELGFEVVTVPPVVIDGETVSSTAIRRAIARGDLRRVEKLLGRPYSLLGTVVRGDGRGALVGYRTANLDLHHELMPPPGVYAGRALLDERPLPGIVSVGTRSTFHHEPDPPVVVEIHLLDQDMDLYGAELEVQLLERIRDQATFDSPCALRKQIEKDIVSARRILARISTWSA